MGKRIARVFGILRGPIALQDFSEFHKKQRMSNMKITFHVFSLFTLLSVFSTISWAASDANLTYNKDDGEWFINMQTSGKATLAITEGQIADGITSFKIYDDGGKNGN